MFLPCCMQSRHLIKISRIFDLGIGPLHILSGIHALLVGRA
jgi:hypothetical protein